MQLVGTRGQQERDYTYGGAGTITTGGTAQLLIPEHKSRALFIFQNLSTANLYLEFGAARATATITSGVVTSVSITNSGFNYTYAPDVFFYGGGNSNNSAHLGVGDYGYPSPGDPAYVWPRTTDLSAQKPAKGHAVLSGTSVNSIAIEDGGAGYNTAPLVFMRNSLRDPFGAATPSTTSGLLIPPSGGYYINGPACPTEPIAIYGGTTGQQFWYKVMP